MVDISARARFHIAPGGNPADPDGWVWENRTADLDHDDVIRSTGGRADEISVVDAAMASLRVDNAGGHYCTRNPLGRWYGRLARNCPARFGVITGAAAWTSTVSNGWPAPDVGTSWTLAGSASDWSSASGMGRRSIATANVAENAILEGANARNGMATFVVSSAVIATGGPLIYGLMVRRTDANSYLMFNVELSTSGSISAKIRRTHPGASTTLANVEPLAFTYSINERIKVRCQWDGPALRLKVWQEADPEPDAWTATATDNLCGGSIVGLRFWRFTSNTNPGALVFYIDDLEIEAVEIIGTIPRFPVRWDPTAQQSWVPLEIAGIIRRLSQGAQPVQSPLYRQLIAQGPHGYWPLQDGSDATRAASALPRGKPASFTEATPGSTEAPGGSSSSFTLNSFANNSRVTGNTVGPPLTANGWAGMALFKLGALPGATRNLIRFFGTGRVYRFQISINDTQIGIEAVDADGATVISTVLAAHSLDVTKWFAVQIETEESGGNTNWSLIWHQVGNGASFLAISNSYTGTADRVTGFTATAPVDNTQVCHVWLGPNTLPFVDYTFLAVAAGYAGETAAARVARLGRENGITVAVEPGDSEPLGPQRIGGPLELQRHAEAADMGVLYEAGATLAYAPRGARYNRPAYWALTIDEDGDIADPAPEPTDDDQRIRNEWTVARVGGSEDTADDPAHIVLNGRYPDSVTLDVQTDDRLFDHASWRVHLGTWGEMRWPQITLNLTGRPDLLTMWLGRPPLTRLLVLGVPAQGPIGEDVDLIVEGWTQEISSHSWVVTLNCSPAKPWDVAVIDGADSRKDSRSSTLAFPVAASATKVPITTSDPMEFWSTTASGYDLKVGGEEMTVSAMSAVSTFANLAIDAGTFEGGVGNWTATGGSIAQSGAQFHGGALSALLTVSGSPAQAYIRPNGAASVPVVPGVTYHVSVWVRSPQTLTVFPAIDYLDANLGYLGGAYGSPVVLVANIWTLLTTSGPATAGAAFAQYGPTVTTPANGNTLFTDDVTFGVVGTNLQVATVTRAVNGITKSHTAGSAISLAKPVFKAL